MIAGVLLLAALAQTPYADAVLKTDGLVGYWRFEESSPSQKAVDSKGGNFATYDPNTQLNVPGFQGLDGGTAFTVSQATRVLQIFPTSDLELVPATAEMWIRVNDPGDFTLNRSVFRQTDGTSNRHWFFGFVAGPDAGTEATHMLLGFTPDGTAGFEQVISPAGLSIGDWHLLDLVLSAQRLAIYVDGKEVNHVVPGAVPPTMTLPIFLGSVTSGSYSFDELALYRGVLSDDVITEHYQLGVGKVSSPRDAGTAPNAFTFGCTSSPGDALTLALMATIAGLALRNRRPS